MPSPFILTPTPRNGTFVVPLNELEATCQQRHNDPCDNPQCTRGSLSCARAFGKGWSAHGGFFELVIVVAIAVVVSICSHPGNADQAQIEVRYVLIDVEQAPAKT
jgi:hypothetical protein